MDDTHPRPPLTRGLLSDSEAGGESCKAFSLPPSRLCRATSLIRGRLWAHGIRTRKKAYLSVRLLSSPVRQDLEGTCPFDPLLLRPRGYLLLTLSVTSAATAATGLAAGRAAGASNALHAFLLRPNHIPGSKADYSHQHNNDQNIFHRLTSFRSAHAPP